jgi:hypothetical protein
VKSSIPNMQANFAGPVRRAAFLRRDRRCAEWRALAKVLIDSINESKLNSLIPSGRTHARSRNSRSTSMRPDWTVPNPSSS